MADALKDPGTDVGRLAQWCPAILEASVAFDVDPYLLAGICLHETEAGWSQLYSRPGRADGWGDGGNGWGLTQVDRRYWRMFVNSPEAGDPRAQFMFTAEFLADNREHFRRHFPKAPESLVLDATIAAYNAGPGAVDFAIRQGKPPDSCTTKRKGEGYAAAVQRRASDLKAAHPHLFTPKPAEVA